MVRKGLWVNRRTDSRKPSPPYPNVKPDSALKEPSGKRALKRH